MTQIQVDCFKDNQKKLMYLRATHDKNLQINITGRGESLKMKKWIRGTGNLSD